MQKTYNLADRLEKLFIWYLFANPLFDIINGIFIFFTREFGYNIKSWVFPITPTLLVRLLFLGLMGLYILLRRDWKCLLPLALIGVAGVISTVMAVFVVKNGYNTFTDMQYVARFLYNVAALLVYTRSLTQSGRNKRSDVMELLRRFFTWSALVVSGSIIACFVLSSLLPMRIGFFSYADRFGYRGASGFYYAANEATAILMLLLPLVVYDFLQVTDYKNKKNWPKLAAPALVVNAMLLIGTKTAFIGVVLTAAAVTVFYIWQSHKNKTKGALKTFALLLAGILLVFLLLSLCGMASSLLASFNGVRNIVEEDPTEETFEHLDDQEQIDVLVNSPWIVRVLLSGRQYYLMKTADAWAEAGPMSWIFGIGRSSRAHTIEMDIFEMLFYYGVFGFIVLIIPYVRSAWSLLRNFFKNKPHLLSFCIVLALTLTFLYAAIAGHVLFSVTGGFYFVIIIIYGDFFYRPESVHPKVKAKESKKSKYSRWA